MTELTPFHLQALSNHYGIEVVAFSLLPLGADTEAWIFKVQASDEKTYFIKLKQTHIHSDNFALLELLQKQGIQPILLPVKTLEGNFIQSLGEATLIVYPFIEAEDGFRRELDDKQWRALGRALRQLHEVTLPLFFQLQIRREIFSAKWRKIMRSILASIDKKMFSSDALSLNFCAFFKKNKPIIQRLVDRADALSQTCGMPLRHFVLCHADLHAGNILIDNQGDFYIVDWDDPILAPKERDLMFIGGGVGNVWNKPNEERWFYEGYGQIEIDRPMLAYYRHERIVEDLAIYSQALLKPSDTHRQGDDFEARAQMYQHVRAMFEPRGVIELAFKTDQ